MTGFGTSNVQSLISASDLSVLCCIHRKLKTPHSEFRFHSLGMISTGLVVFSFAFSYFINTKIDGEIDNLQPALETCHCETARTEGMREFFFPKRRKHSWLFLPGFI